MERGYLLSGMVNMSCMSNVDACQCFDSKPRVGDRAFA
jgi:hypothetical protein